MQSELFDKPDSIGKSDVEYVQARSILTKASGFMSTYDYTLNPYTGCSFGCTYCYAAFFTRDVSRQNNWGKWVDVKENALALLKKKRSRPLHGKTIYMSSVTDPYQPIEKSLELTRAILHELAVYHRPRLVVQTRSPLVTRDIDLLCRFEQVQVNMTVTTDSEEVRMAFEPGCPSNKVRLNAIRAIQEAELDACITMTPLLPVKDPCAFADKLLETGVVKFIVQPFHTNRGRFVAGTRAQAMDIMERFGWGEERYAEVLNILKQRLPHLGEGKEGFSPE